MDNRDEVRATFAQAFIKRTTDEWLGILLEADIWCAPVFTLADVEKDPQVAANDMIVQYEHPTVGTVRGLGMPIQFSQTTNEMRVPRRRFASAAENLRNSAGIRPDPPCVSTAWLIAEWGERSYKTT
jgi:crotonobetainyl-CoA:carnitine CoA-transferase CaiB-like acyl-CoA transferase